MGEMAQTATRLVVVGRGRLIADTTVDEFIAQASHHAVTVRTPEAARLHDLLIGTVSTVITADIKHPDVLEVDGLTAEIIGAIAWRHRVPIFELTVRQASLEEAFMTLTSDSVEYRSTDNTGPATTNTATTNTATTGTAAAAA
jgi:ABC-2 type transport system ATP-binding protein